MSVQVSVMDQTSSFLPAHKSNVGIRTLCHLLLATSSGGRSAFVECTCPALPVVVTEEGASEGMAVTCMLINACGVRKNKYFLLI